MTMIMYKYTRGLVVSIKKSLILFLSCEARAVRMLVPCPDSPATPAARSAVGTQQPSGDRGPLHSRVPPHPKTDPSGVAHKELSVGVEVEYVAKFRELWGHSSFKAFWGDQLWPIWRLLLRSPPLLQWPNSFFLKAKLPPQPLTLSPSYLVQLRA